jgi:serine/threonine protein kinase/WD40 repeat protein
MDSREMSRFASHCGDARLEQIIEAAVSELEDGDAFDVESLAATHPEFADQLRDLLPMVAALVELGGAVGDPAELIAGHDLGKSERRLGDFRILHELGRGGMGAVFEAEQLSMGRRVALKVLPFAALANNQALQRFRNEVRAAAALDHPHIVSVYSVGEERGVHFYAMQLVRGQTLAEHIEQLRACRGVPGPGVSRDAGVCGREHEALTLDSASVPPPTQPLTLAPISTVANAGRADDRFRAAARLGIQAADALQHAHDQGVLHRDVKPGNLLLDREGQLSITDFGLARIEADAGMTMTGDLFGTLRYMAPEQALAKRGCIDHRADIYSLGATLYELLTLQPAFGETDRELLLQQIAGDDPRPLRKIDRRIPAELETVVLTAMAKTPDDRYQSAGRLADDLRAFVEHRPITARPASLEDRVRKWARRHQGLVRTAAIALLLTTAVLTISVASVKRAQLQAVAALDKTNELLYAADLSAAYQSFEKGWTDEAQAILDRYRPGSADGDRRGLEWQLLQYQIREPVAFTLAGHEGSVTELAVFPDGQRLASVGADGKLCIWDARGRRLLQTIPLAKERLESVAISPDGRYVAAGSTVVSLCDLQRDAHVSEIFRSEHNIESIAFHPDGKHLAAGIRYHEVCVLSLAGEIDRRILCDARIESLEYSPNGGQLLAPNRRPRFDHNPIGIAELWRADLSHLDREIDASEPEKPGAISVARFSPDGQFIAAGERYKARTYLIDAMTGEVLAETPVSRDRVSDVAYAPSGRAFAVGYRNGRVEYFAFQKDAHGIPSISRRPLVVNAHRGEVTSLRFIDDATIATSGADGLVRIWQLPGNPGVALDLSDGELDSLAISPDGTRLLYVTRREYMIVDAVSRDAIFRCANAEQSYRSGAWAPSGDRAAVCFANSNSVVVFERSGRTLCTIKHPEEPTDIAFAPDGASMAILSVGHLQIARTDNGQTLLNRPVTSQCFTVAYSHDGTKLVYGGAFGAIVVFDIAHQRVLAHLGCASDVHRLAFSPDDSLLATGHGDSIIRLWDLKSGEARGELVGHRRALLDLAFSPDARTLLSSADDGSIRVWSVDHQRPYGVLFQRSELGRNDCRCRLSMSPDGRSLAIGFRSHDSARRNVLLWKVDPLAIK